LPVRTGKGGEQREEMGNRRKVKGTAVSTGGCTPALPNLQWGWGQG
jgi:hypothetical protein